MYKLKITNSKLFKNFFCREEGIRTLDTVTRILPFQGSSLNHSDTSLYQLIDCKYIINNFIKLFKLVLSLKNKKNNSK